MNIKRHALLDLLAWKTDKERKPLIIRGARQVGKTTLVKEFAKSYKQSILLNLEKKIDRNYFEDQEDVKTIVTSIFLSYGVSEDWNNTLLFIDEIQESPKAIQLLRYFYEELPDLPVIAAGSLLEFAMSDIRSFPVGRVSYLYLYPINFDEYIAADGNDRLVGELQHIPVKDYAHDVLLRKFHEYAIIGGMPEVVQKYISSQSMINLPVVYESIWATYKDDVGKYAKNNMEKKVIKHILNTAPVYLDKRIKFQHFGNSNYRSREVGEALRNLDDAKVVRLIYPTTVIEPPIQPDYKKSPRLQFLDTGLVNHALGIQPQLLAMTDLSSAYKGALIPHLITQELISLTSLTDTKPNFWVREKTQASSEVDLLFVFGTKIIPIEVKSGKSGSLKSLHQFIEQSPHPYAVRIYGGKFNIAKQKTPKGTPYLLMDLPYYLGTKIPAYIKYFVGNYKPMSFN